MDKTPLVAIRCMTYNHAPYIVNAMNGFCMQQTNFPFVAIIVDDSSTDGGQDVIKNYLKDHFDVSNAHQRENDDAYFIEVKHKDNQNCWFAVVFLKYNFWQAKKQKDTLIAEWQDPAKYIALCEGDDYWINENKLQEEVEFLDNNPDYGLVYTDYDIQNYDNGDYTHAIFKNGIKPIISSFEQHLVNKAYIAPMSWLCRIPFQELMNSYKGPPSKDGTFIIALELFLKSKVFYLEKVTCVYGVHTGSATRQASYSKQYEYAHGVYATQRFYLEKYKLREKYPDCLDYFLHAYYNYILAKKITEEYPEIQSYFHRKSGSSIKFLILDCLMRSKFTIPLLQNICKMRLSNHIL